MTVSCPLDCEYLQDARQHEKRAPVDPAKLPDPDIRISDEFLSENDKLLMALSAILAETALETPQVVDSDVKDMLAALIRTYRTLQAGVYYESRPDNALASRLFGAVQERIGEFRAREQRDLGLGKTRDADILGCLVFLARVEMGSNNGRSRGRAFIDLLRDLAQAPERSGARRESLLVVP